MTAIQEAKAQIRTIANDAGTDPDVSVFLLGPYNPTSCRDFLNNSKETLMGEYGITAFLEDEISMHYTIGAKFDALTDASSLSTFLIPKDFQTTGWQTEIGQILPLYPEKVAIYYENWKRFPMVTRDLIATNGRHHAPIIDSNCTRESILDVCNHINTILSRIP